MVNSHVLVSKQDGMKHNYDDDEDETPSVYFVGNSLGAQPKSIRTHLDAQLETWASIAVNGHFMTFENSPLAAWQDMAADCAQISVGLVGAASPTEVIYMNTLTVNLHLMMASFFRPTEKRHKIIAEWKPFPSDSVRYFFSPHHRPSEAKPSNKPATVRNRFPAAMAQSRPIHIPR